jgi:hypothetical protein
MQAQPRLSQVLVIVGLIAMVLGAIDPLEGSVVILAGAGLAALGAFLGQSRRLRLLLLASSLLAVGVGALFAMSAVGGIGGKTGRSMWWALILLPYPVGWILGLTGVVLRLRDLAKGSPPAEP